MIPDIRPQVEALVAHVRAEDAAEIHRLKLLVDQQHATIDILRGQGRLLGDQVAELRERVSNARALRERICTTLEVTRLSRDKWRRRAMGLRVPDVVSPSALEAAHKRIDEQAREIAVLKAVNHINKCRLERIDKNRLSMMLEEQRPKQYEPVPENMENWCRSCDTQKASDGLNSPSC